MQNNKRSSAICFNSLLDDLTNDKRYALFLVNAWLYSAHAAN